METVTAEPPINGAVIESDFRVTLAATYLEDAVSHRHFEFNTTPQGVRTYRLFKLPVLQYLLYFCFLLNILLALVETPARPGWEWPLWSTLLLEMTCLTFFMARLFHEMLASVDIRSFWKDTKHVTNALIILLTLIDICVYVAMREGHPQSSTSEGKTSGHEVRFSRALRPFLLVNFTEARQIRRAFRNIRRTLPDLANVLILFLASLSLFSLMAVKLFQKKKLGESGNGYFADFFDSFWDLYVLVTTANSPDVMMPAYDTNQGYIVFFVAFLLVNLYLFMRVFLAVIYNSYKNNLRLEVEASMKLKRDLIRKSFESLLAQHESLTNSLISKQTFKVVMKSTASDRKDEFWEVCWLILDHKNEGTIPFNEFGHIPELLHLRVVDIQDKRAAWFPSLYNSPWSKILIKGIRHIYFRYLFDAIIFLNAMFIGFDLDGGEPFFLALFTLEIVLKLYAFGFRAFARKLWNLFDVVVVGSALLITIIEAIESHDHSQVALDFLMVLRVIRIFKIFHSVVRFRIVINTILHILPSMFTYGGVLLVFYYAFAIIGMEVFGGKVSYHGYDEANQIYSDKYCGNPLLKDSDFYKDHYCSNNFNDLISAFVTLFELMTVNQWHVITDGFVRVTSKSARLYFFCFHFICVTVILNIFSAFVIEAFILEFSVTSEANTTENANDSQKPQTTVLTERIAAMGLGYGKAEAATVSSNIKNNANDDLQELVNEDDFLDADHGTTQLPKVPSNNPEDALPSTTSYSDHSSKTGLRFVLTSRTRTVMGLLEKMFET